jgi:hypothetical protein
LHFFRRSRARRCPPFLTQRISNLDGLDGGSGWGLVSSRAAAAGDLLVSLPAACQLSYEERTLSPSLRALLAQVPAELWVRLVRGRGQCFFLAASTRRLRKRGKTAHACVPVRSATCSRRARASASSCLTSAQKARTHLHAAPPSAAH